MNPAIDLLLREMESGFVVPQLYSRRSWSSRCAPLTFTAFTWMVAALAYAVVLEMGRPQRV